MSAATDTLDTLTDAQLNEAFAREVAGAVEHVIQETHDCGVCRHCGWEPWEDDKPCSRNYSTDTNTVLPWLEKAKAEKLVAGCEMLLNAAPWVCYLHSFHEEALPDCPTIPKDIQAHAPTFARAGCIGLIRAARAVKALS